MRRGAVRPEWALGAAAIGALWAASCVLDRGGGLADTTGSGDVGPGGAGGNDSTSVTTGGAGGGSTTTTTSSTTSSSSTGGMGGGGNQGGGGMGGGCSDGTIEPGEECDDQDLDDGDGCSSLCMIEQGWECSGQPSVCQPIAPTVTQGAGLPLTIPDDGYNGSMASGACTTFNVANPHLGIVGVRATVAVSHTYIGDLVIKLSSPALTVTTLMSRPGLAEPSDRGVDQVNNVYGDGSNLAMAFPITFQDNGAKDAETMGDNLQMAEAVCQQDNICTFIPNSDAGPGTNLGDFNGQNPNGTWMLCIGDASAIATGTFDSASLEILAW